MNILLIIQDKDQISKEAYRIYEKLKLAQCVPLDVFGKVRYFTSVSVTVTLSPFICFFLSLSFFYTPSVSLSLSLSDTFSLSLSLSFCLAVSLIALFHFPPAYLSISHPLYIIYFKQIYLAHYPHPFFLVVLSDDCSTFSTSFYHVFPLLLPSLPPCLPLPPPFLNSLLSLSKPSR